MHKLYRELAWLYDKIYPTIFDYDKVYQNISGFLEQHQCQTILEVGCGSGRLMEILENNGYEVTGLDLNQEMLDIARSRCSGKLIKQDIREIYLNINFDALICLGRTFGYMLNNHDADRAIKSFNKALRKGGLLIMDSFDADVTRRYNFGEVRENSFEFEDMKIIRRSKSFGYDISDSTWLVDWEYVIENDSRYSVLDNAKLRSYNKGELQKMLYHNGFKD
ncbi:class I SAM-dependent DNA methyltransferase [Thermoproteota archaeon]